MIDYSQILTINYPNSQWALGGDTYDGLIWLSSDQKPTQAELDALWPSTEDQIAKNNCKSQATTLLNQTDWISTADVGDPTKANPYLINQAEFIAYRSTVRKYAVNPVVNPTWPIQPTEQWSS